MAYNSLLGYAKDGVAEVVASSKTTMSVIDHWALDAYRNLKFYSPTTGELKTWLEANAVRLPLTGTWVFNNVISNKNAPGICNISFTCDGTSYTKIEITATGSIYYGGTGPQYDMKWGDNSYRTITFTEPVKYEGNEEFIRWFVDNAVPAEGGVSFKLNDTITLSIQPQNVSWTSDRVAKVPSYYCTPYFINNFKIGNKSYTYFGAHKDATIYKAHRQIDGSVTYDTVAGLTMYLNILPDESFYSQNTLTGQTSIVYPDYPLSVTANTSGIILVFEELPTGSFLTWLNENATLIPTIK